VRLLVTGGAGFIGANFVHYTRSRYPEHDVTVYDALTYAGNRASLASVEDDIRFVEGDITDAATLDGLVADSDVVVNFAAETHNDNSLVRPRTFIETNVAGTFEVLEAVRRHGKRLHHISTDEVYGDLPRGDSRKFTEDSPFNASSPYSASKASADMLVGAWRRSYGIAATVSNCSNNYGPYQHVEKFIPRAITNILRGVRPKVYGAGRNVRDWIHVDDHNSAVWTILEDGQPGHTYLIGADGEADNLTVVAMILQLMGEPSDWYDHVSDRPGHDVRYAIDAAKLRRELGWAPAYGSFRDGLARTIKWYEANEWWWRPARDAVEATYALHERPWTPPT
jgi:dTDP-glucose 4,6-dehydratase